MTPQYIEHPPTKLTTVEIGSIVAFVLTGLLVLAVILQEHYCIFN